MPRTGTACFLLFALFLTGAEVVRLAWFSWGIPGWDGELVLSLKQPEDGAHGFERLSLAGTRGGEALAYDYGELLRLFDPEHETWSMDLYYLEYEPGNGRQLTDLFVHSPEVCLRASGSRLVRTLPPVEATIGSHALQARHLVFVNPVHPREFHVFKLVWLGRMAELGIEGDENDFRKVRLKAARGRVARPPARLILCSVSGAASDQEARRLFGEQVLDRCFFMPAGRQ